MKNPSAKMAESHLIRIRKSLWRMSQIADEIAASDSDMRAWMSGSFTAVEAAEDRLLELALF